MGLLNKLGLKGEKRLDRFLEDPTAYEVERTPMEDIRDAVAYMVAKMMLADGVVQQAERRMAKGIFQSSSLFFHVEDDEYDSYLAAILDMAKQADGKTEKMAIDILREGEWDFTALAMMTDLMISDGRIHPAEMQTLRHMAKMFGIDQKQVNSMVNTFRARRRNWGDPPLGASDGSAKKHHADMMAQTGPAVSPRAETRGWLGNKDKDAAPADPVVEARAPEPTSAPVGIGAGSV